MKPNHWYLLMLCWLLVSNECSGSIVFGSAAIGVVSAALYASFDKLKCQFYECCPKDNTFSEYINPNMTGLLALLDANVHGQHLVREVVIGALKSHYANDDPSKALVMSFHGWTGGGKNYVARFIADSVYKLGTRSAYVHTFISTVHFPHESQADIYKMQLQDWIRGNVTACSRSLFIFDEIDKLPVGMIDAIKPFIDYHESIFGVDFRKSVFIFLSNTGGPEITRKTLEWWRRGEKRGDISLADMEELVKVGAFNEKGGLHKSDLIHHSLVDHFIPFLPLERGHVEMCIEDEVKRRGHRPNPELIKKVADELMYFPPENRLFSTTGCKRVSQKVGYVITNERFDRLFD